MKTPEQREAYNLYMREWFQKNRNRINQQRREKRLRNPKESKEKQRLATQKYRASLDPEVLKAKRRAEYKKKGRPLGEAHHAWLSENVPYVTIHAWVVRHRGKPKLCEHCGSTEKKKYEWANKDHSYKRILNDYIRLCTSCHRKYDMQNNNYKRKTI